MSVALYGSAFALGALGSAHCATMCGGVAGLFCAAGPTEARHRGSRAAGYVLSYNAGRMISYGSAGIVLGAAGAATLRTAPILGPQYVLRAAAALAMIAMGLAIGRIIRLPSALEAIGRRVSSWVEPLLKPMLPLRNPAYALALGLLWGWMPCGLLYAGLALALTSGSAVAGGLTMLSFAAGTIPAMLLVGGAAQWIARWMQSPKVRVIAGLLLVVSGTLNGLTVLQQIGWIALPGSTQVATHCAH